MKKIILAIALGSLAALLTSCGGSYKKVQSPEDQAQFTCVGLHTKRAQWHFVDELGQNVSAQGSCIKGMKHGQFEFFVNGKMVAKTKFGKDREIKTACLAMGKTKMNLNDCMKVNASNNNPQGSSVTTSTDASTDASTETSSETSTETSSEE